MQMVDEVCCGGISALKQNQEERRVSEKNALKYNRFVGEEHILTYIPSGAGKMKKIDSYLRG